ncbi:type III secretion system stator protein SctL [Pseudomonas fluorescens]|uniref:type III secretion system stator protein SctL n=1 Tax=Pseudomonas fluorescens TaxID=294 RepID=UPI00177F3753|nr:type III secretion system stator protein SctL [Pseudomonas fluorescens]MBD8194196.1 type III secretion system stator protein SctL [Pseudomonas fluorescens]MBD8228995.1 type III secretion system stator protein SctL [Pseudomonas fluorescens]MBD8787006.1 type III secretion system stator protein SctL [Pseudomonas fluorescens]MBD8819160.1 type III secretion system stator protein SctL [Pseudomonas fluorescens]
MLCKHTIEKLNGVSKLPGNIIYREELKNWAQANQLLTRANAQADELLSLTKKKCEDLQEKTSQIIWQRADAQLKRWEHDRQAMCEKLEQYASSITNEAIRCLLDETAEPKRLAALLKQLIANQVQEVSATLLCHPNDLEELRQCLIFHNTTVWKLYADETTPPKTLILKTEEGDFRVSWDSMLDSFFKHGEQYWVET